MSEKVTSIFQSGERVHINGTYEVIGIGRSAAPRKQEASIRNFRVGERFCCYDGFEVIWRLISAETTEVARIADTGMRSH